MVTDSYLWHNKSTEVVKTFLSKISTTSPPFNAIWETLLQLLLVFLFSLSFISNFSKISSDPTPVVITWRTS